MQLEEHPNICEENKLVSFNSWAEGNSSILFGSETLVIKYSRFMVSWWTPTSSGRESRRRWNKRWAKKSEKEEVLPNKFLFEISWNDTKILEHGQKGWVTVFFNTTEWILQKVENYAFTASWERRWNEYFSRFLRFSGRRFRNGIHLVLGLELMKNGVRVSSENSIFSRLRNRWKLPLQAHRRREELLRKNRIQNILTANPKMQNSLLILSKGILIYS